MDLLVSKQRQKFRAIQVSEFNEIGPLYSIIYINYHQQKEICRLCFPFPRPLQLQPNSEQNSKKPAQNH